jgi:uncharacterized protein
MGMEQKRIAPENKNPLFPVFLKLEQLQVLLVGAGKIGHEKLLAVVSNAPQASVTIVAEWVSPEVQELAALYPKVLIVRKKFEESDLEGKNIVLVAVNDPAMSYSISRLAKERNLLANVADRPGQCDFYLGAIVQKGTLKIAISTNGNSPTIAKRMRELLQDALPEEIDELIMNLNAIRNRLTGDFGEKVEQLNAITRSLSARAGV